MWITRNPYQRAAAGCILIALVLTTVGVKWAAVPALALGVVFAFIAYMERDRYPR